MKTLLIATLAAALSLPALQAVPAYADHRGWRGSDVCHPNYEPRGGYPDICFRIYPHYCFGTRDFDPRYDYNRNCSNTWDNRGRHRHYDNYDRHRYGHHGSNDGADIMLGIIGLAVGAIIADQRRRQFER